ncbi:MAG: RDD family protein [Betaproteobacteria bacterium]|nr:RDD family protein [Betaproteobacteria bacterium]
MLDTGRRIATPEGIELSLRLAGPVPRALAWTIDLMIRLAILFAAAMALSQLGNFGMGLFFLGWFLLEWLFPAWCEVAWGGATPGKKALGLLVLHDDGTPVRWPAALTRNLLRAIDFLPLFYGFGLVAMLMNRDFKRLGDLVAGTVVVYREEKLAGFRIPPAAPLPPPAALTLAEQRAVLDFAERSPGLTEERAAELATIARALVGKLEGRDATERLVRIANHLVGRRG